MQLLLHLGIEQFFVIYSQRGKHIKQQQQYIYRREGGQKQAKVRKSGFVFLVFDYTQRILAAAPVY